MRTRKRPAHPCTVFVFTESERGNIRRAVRFLCKSHGSCRALGAAIGMSRSGVEKISRQASFVTPATVFRIAHLVGVPVDDIVTGKWPPANVCPHCGQPGPQKK